MSGNVSSACWCGEPDPYFAEAPYRSCGGMLVLYCDCGGDQCVCHNHGEVDCPGCSECDDEAPGAVEWEAM